MLPAALEYPSWNRWKYNAYVFTYIFKEKSIYVPSVRSPFWRISRPNHMGELSASCLWPGCPATIPYLACVWHGRSILEPPSVKSNHKTVGFLRQNSTVTSQRHRKEVIFKNFKEPSTELNTAMIWRAFQGICVFICTRQYKKGTLHRLLDYWVWIYVLYTRSAVALFPRPLCLITLFTWKRSSDNVVAHRRRASVSSLLPR